MHVQRYLPCDIINNVEWGNVNFLLYASAIFVYDTHYFYILKLNQVSKFKIKTLLIELYRVWDFF